jgi:hypothetical protein
MTVTVNNLCLLVMFQLEFLGHEPVVGFRMRGMGGLIKAPNTKLAEFQTHTSPSVLRDQPPSSQDWVVHRQGCSRNPDLLSGHKFLLRRCFTKFAPHPSLLGLFHRTAIDQRTLHNSWTIEHASTC